MEIALIYRWAVFILLVLGLILLMKHGVLTPFVFWSRIQYYTFSDVYKRQAYYNKEIEEGDPRQNETELILAKNRNGPVGTIKMFFAGQYTLFYCLLYTSRCV